jgi:hypothetical protein
VKPHHLLILLLVVTTVGAEETLYAGDYLSPGFGARPLALGGAYGALALDAAAPAFNPAGLAYAGSYGGLFMHSSRFDNLVVYDALSGFYRLGEKGGTLGAAWIRSGVDDIKLTRWDDDGRPEVYDVVDTSANAFYLSYARELLPNLSLGATLKYLHDDVAAATADGFGFDLGLLWRPAPRTALSLTAHDPYTYKEWSNGTTDVFEPRLRLGGAWGFDLADIDTVLTLAGDAEFILADYGESAQLDLDGLGLDLHGGFEFTVARVFSARVGADRGKLTLGGGVALWGMSLDYCWLSHELGDTHRVSLSAAF